MRARIVVPGVLAVALAVGVLVGTRLPGGTAATAAPGPSTPAPTTTASPQASPSQTGVTPPDGATQPNADNYPITKLAPGETPPQFVVVSFDGACTHDLFQHYFDLGQQTNSRFTFFLSGLCLVPDAQHLLYKPPRQPAGTSAIGFADPKMINGRIEDWSRAYDNGFEIGTHFLGHFCGPGGVGTWSKADWLSEIAQARRFLDDWAQVNATNKYADLALKLSFDSSVFKGDRSPCLEGRRDQMYPAFATAGFAYDASNSGLLRWPTKLAGYDMWNFPMPVIKLVGYPGDRHAIGMDYNFLYTMNGGTTTASKAKCDQIKKVTYDSYMAALAAVHAGNRAPYVVGNHFNTWACGAFRDALTAFVQNAHTTYPDVRFVSFDYLARWLDAQDPKVRRQLAQLPAVAG